MKMNFTYMNIRSGITSDKNLRFTFGNVHEMPGWNTWLSEFFIIFVSLFVEIGWSRVWYFPFLTQKIVV